MLRILAITVSIVGLLPSTAMAQIRSSAYVTGLSQPVAFVADPSAANVQYIVEQGGRIRVVLNGVLQPTDFLNLSAVISTGGERGLLGLVFSPDYATSGRFFVNFTNPQGHTVIARFKRSGGNALAADPATRFDFLWPDGNRFITQPFANHNGGSLVFGPDGYLYIALGDGGSGNDPFHLAQNPNSLLGKMLRLNVAVGDGDPEGYDIPSDNPFLDGLPVSALGEIWAFGLRNPWKFSFDDPTRGGTGALVVGDVGQGTWEEIDYEPADQGGRNYGWRNREGAHDNVTNLSPAYLPLIDPIFEYNHAEGRSITGGYVYRGTALTPTFKGRYFFADFVAGRVWSLGLSISPITGEASATNLMEHTAELGGSPTLGLISSFGVDAQGELYVVSWSNGSVLRILPDTPRMNLETPVGGVVTQPFALAGWALDMAATTGTGVDTVHVWAYPNPGSGASPFFVGVASSGGPRPDVGAVFGSQFSSSGFGLTVQGLAVGTYQFVAHAHSSVTGTFDIAQSVTVTISAPVSNPRIAIDTPGEVSSVFQEFLVAGWALDLGAPSGTGVDTGPRLRVPKPRLWRQPALPGRRFLRRRTSGCWCGLRTALYQLSLWVDGQRPQSWPLPDRCLCAQYR